MVTSRSPSDGEYEGVPASWQVAKFADIQTFSDDSDITSGVFQVNSHNDYDYDLHLTNNKGTIEVTTGSEKIRKNTSSQTLPEPIIDMKN